ncbi:uncharacterized protein EV420DRAFT_673883 [Desarmillaria tabescens]|uniref:LYC1 C-terminal domain-containing protein n=1 Tax=Armillaria tabescens TaxID=1929756 RepID=A0AA39TZ44_ARMTA|nr:uncharacterized protein EV420DRAFT_673883 [Desarmillaria tabescens]KAK0467249.1 hypothetical protein EV420DRAFT_673883 [Desarmillaria tabescens]
MNLSSLTIFPATPAQVLESRRRSFVHWGGPLTEEEFFRLATEVEQGESATNGKLTAWVLSPRDDPGSLDFKCSCMTFRRKGLILRGHNAHKADAMVPEEVSCYGVAAVLTPERFRRQGYAKHMMRLLHWVLAVDPSLFPMFPKTWGSPPQRPAGIHPGHFSVLWSDVGDFYRSCGPTDSVPGWVLDDASTTVWDVKTLDVDATTDSISNEKWRWLAVDDIQALYPADEEKLKQDLIAKSLGLDSGKTLFTFLPGQGVEMFQRTKLGFFWRKLESPVTHWGVISRSSDKATHDDDTVFATWTFEAVPKTLLITRLRANQENFGDLFSVLKFVAGRHGIEKIEIWCLPDALKSVAQHHGAIHFERKEHLPALKWYGAESPTDVIWLNREKFCWC